MNSITQSPQKINNEIWKDIPGYVGFYQVSNYGRVRSRNRITRHNRQLKGKLLKQKVSKTGYKYVTLQKDRISKCMRVHCIVMLVFIGKRPCNHDIHHIDNNKSNNSLVNLVYMPNKDHQLTINRPKGVRNGNAKLNSDKIIKIRSLYNSGYSQRAIAKIFNISQGTTHQIVTRKTWNHVK